MRVRHFLPTLCLLLAAAPAAYAQPVTIELEYQWSDPNMTPSYAFGNPYNEVWGFVQGGREYGVFGTSWGTHIFDLDAPGGPFPVDSFQGAFSGSGVIHRDYHDHNGYLYAVCDEGGLASTLQIVDLSYLPDSVSVVYDENTQLATAHNIFIDSAQDRMYAFLARGPSFFTSVGVFDISDPVNPNLVHEFDEGTSAHDGYIVDDVMYLNDGWNGRLIVVDWSDVTAPVILGSLDAYPDQGYNHSGWLHDDGVTYVFADEDHGHDMKVCDVSDPTDIQVLTTFGSGVAPNSIPHNQLFRGDYLFTAYYHDGLYIHDLSDPANPEYVAHYKTYQPSDHDSYRGAWGVYPLLPSGRILVSDMQYGFFVFSVDGLDLGTPSGISEPVFTVTRVAPNPAVESIRLEVEAAERRSGRLVLLDLKGRELRTEPVEWSPGRNVHTIELGATMPAGLYVLRLEAGDAGFVEQIVKL